MSASRTAPDREHRNDLNDFFVRYGDALANGDLSGVSGSYAVPALVVFDGGALAFAEREEIERAFAGAAERYRAAGLVAARPAIIGAEPLTDLLVSVDVRWDYLDDRGTSRQRDGYRYLVRLTDEGPRIQVVVTTPSRPGMNADC